MLTQFRSPQLLMVSGIGPEETLKGLKIPVISHLRGVGQNLAVNSAIRNVLFRESYLSFQDQPFFGANFRVNVTTQSQLSSNGTFVSEAIKEYLENQSGPLTTSVSNYLGQIQRSPLSSNVMMIREKLTCIARPVFRMGKDSGEISASVQSEHSERSCQVPHRLAGDPIRSHPRRWSSHKRQRKLHVDLRLPPDNHFPRQRDDQFHRYERQPHRQSQLAGNRNRSATRSRGIQACARNCSGNRHRRGPRVCPRPYCPD